MREAHALALNWGLCATSAATCREAEEKEAQATPNKRRCSDVTKEECASPHACGMLTWHGGMAWGHGRGCGKDVLGSFRSQMFACAGEGQRGRGEGHDHFVHWAVHMGGYMSFLCGHIAAY
mmetsp:Transcript_8665/g.22631  ORF Transcript_8665/g.22631 Transcript_8665/m.22631 type:complete len:121 (+) Transcript_8665:332-694(+)